MPTTKHRIQVPVEEATRKALESLAKKRGLSFSALSKTLLEEALEIQEDIYFSKKGDQVLAELDEGELVSHKQAW